MMIPLITGRQQEAHKGFLLRARSVVIPTITQTIKNRLKASYLSTSKRFQLSWQLDDTLFLQLVCSEIDKVVVGGAEGTLT